MKDSGTIKNLLKKYDIPQVDENQISECIKVSRNAMMMKKVRRDDSLQFFVETQMQYMRKETVFSVCFVICLLFVLAVTRIMTLSDDLLNVSVGIAPFLVVPIIISMKKSKFYGMIELEMASKHSLKKIIALRIFFNQIMGAFVILLTWLLGGIRIKTFEINLLFFSFISFAIASITFLYFGKSAIKYGVSATLVWTLMTIIFLSWDKAVVCMLAINSMVLFAVTVMMGVAVAVTTVRYIKQVSFESEEEKWNLRWID